MRHKFSLNSKVLTCAFEQETFLETSEADLFFRWQKEIRLFTRKDGGSRPLKRSVAEKN